jgi:iron complex outermembrane receptor protein
MILSRKNLLRTAIQLVTTTCLIVVGTITAQAQEAEEERMSALEEVIVTARKREENVMDIPVSVNVFTADMMAAANIVDINDLAAKTPGLKFNSAFGRQGDRPVIRGISSIFTGVELVGYFIDGVYVAGSMQSYDLTSIERVEVIKGPQSATFGRRTFAGAINYVTAHPQEELEIEARATMGSNGLIDLSALLGGRTSEKFGYRLNVRGYKYDGDFENAKVDGPSVGGQETLSANLGLFFYLSEATTIRLNFNYSDDDDEHYAISMFRRADLDVCRSDVTTPYHCGTIPGSIQPNLGGVLDNKDHGVQRERKRFFIKLDHEFDWATFSWTSAFNKEDYYAGQDQTFMGLETVFSFATFGQVPAYAWHTRGWSDTEDQSHEAWFRGVAADGRLNWGIGAYYYDEDYNSLTLEADDNISSVTDRKVKNTAVMAMLDYSFNDAFKLGGEIRRAKDDIKDNEFSNAWKSTTYRVTGTWNYSDTGMAYISYSTGVLPGGFNTDPRLPEEFEFIDEQTMKNFEIGWKATIAEKLVLTAAIFDMEWKDQVRSEFYIDIPTDSSIGYRSNQGTSDIRGIEFNAHWYPTNRLHFEVGGSFVDTEIHDFISADATDIQWSDNKDGDVEGNQIPLSPEKETYLAGTYTHPLSNGLSLATRVDYSYQSKRYVRTINWADTGSESLLGAQVSLLANNWSVMLWGKNLTDEDSATSALRYFEANSFFFSGRSFAVTPRPGAEYGVTFRYNF